MSAVLTKEVLPPCPAQTCVVCDPRALAPAKASQIGSILVLCIIAAIAASELALLFMRAIR